MRRVAFVFLALVAALSPARAQIVLKVGDQKGNAQAVMEVAGVLKDTPYTIAWKEFPAAAPLLEALGAGAIDTVLSAMRRSPLLLPPVYR
jgi:sulfonate transport system substrate-binding protein